MRFFTVILPGTFLGKSFSAAAKAVFEMRGEAAHGPSPATADEIHAGLMQGTFDFKNSDVEDQKQSIRISLGKNSAMFVKLPKTELFGLAEWYPGLKKGNAAK
jgi:hypothetical protein